MEFSRSTDEYIHQAEVNTDNSPSSFEEGLLSVY